MSSSANYKPTPGAALPAILLAPTQTTEQIVPSAVQANVAVAGGTQLQNVALVCTVPANSILDGQEFDISISGNITTGGTTNVTGKLYSGSSLTPGSNTALGTSGAIAQNSAGAPFLLKARNCVYDSISGKLTGIFEATINNTLATAAAFTNVIASLSATGDPILSFCFSFTFSAAFATNKVTVKNFAIDF